MGALQDVQYAARRLRSSPISSLVIVASLACGLGAALTVYAWLDALVYRPLTGVPAQFQLVVIDGRASSGRDQRLSYPEVRDLRESLLEQADVLAYTYQPFALSTGDHADRVWGQLVTANFFDVLGIVPARGRAFRAAEEREGAGPVAVISDRLWQSRFNGVEDAIGRTIEINSQKLTVIGIAPASFQGVAIGLMLDIWIPVGMQPLLAGGGPNRLHDRSQRWLGSYGRVRSGASPAALRGALTPISQRLAREHPDTNTGASFTATSVPDAPWGGTTVVRPVLTVLLALVIVLLAATCANVTNALLAAMMTRRQEIATRTAVGGSRLQIMRQLVIEIAVLGAIATAAAVIVALGSASTFRALLPPTGFPIGFVVATDIRLVAIAALAMTAVVGIISILPATVVLRTPAWITLKEHAGNAGGSRGRQMARGVLVAAQVALSIVLLIVCGTMTTSLRTSLRVDPGFDVRHTLLASIDFNQQGYAPATALQTMRRITEGIEAVPGVRVAAAAQRVPLDFGGRALIHARLDGHVGRLGEEIMLAANHVSPRYLESMAIPLLEGREFTWMDTDRSEPVAIVNARASTIYGGGQSVLGRLVDANGVRRRIVGIMDDVLAEGLSQPPPPAMLIPVTQDYRPTMVIHVRTQGDPGEATQAVRGVVTNIDPTLALYDVRTMTAHMGVPTFPFRLGAIVSLVLAVVTILLSALGLYGLVANTVAQQRRELGIRMAVGATRSQVYRVALTPVIVPVVAGSLLGLGIAAASARRLGVIIAGLTTDSTTVYVVAVALAGAMAIVATASALRRFDVTDTMRLIRE